MLDQTGTGRINFEDVLREIGYFIDKNNLRETCIVELKEGFLLRGIRFAADRGGYQTLSESFLFTNEDIERAVNEGEERRQAEEQRRLQQQQQQQQQPKRGLFG